MGVVQITTEALFHTAGEHLVILRDAGLTVGYPARAPLVTEEETLAAMRGAVAVLAGSDPYTARVLAGLPDLRVISRNGVGYDRIDLEAATEHGVAVTITPRGNCEAVAEHTLALLLALTRRVVQNDRDTRQVDWRRAVQLTPLRGKTLGIVGLGRIGRCVALRTAGFKMRLVSYDPVPDEGFAREHGIALVDLDTLLSESDFVTLNLPLSPATRGLINRQSLARMRPGCLLINTARGGLIVEEDLVDALRSGRLGGAGLDVFVDEPAPADHPLLSLDNVVLSPHIAGLDAQSIVDMANDAARNIVDVLAGRWPLDSLLNPAVCQRARR